MCDSTEDTSFGIVFNSMLKASWFVCELFVHLCNIINLMKAS